MARAFGPQNRPWKCGNRKRRDFHISTAATAILSFPTANSKKRTRHSLTPLIHEKEALTQAEAAIHFQVTQPRISDLMRGEISRFSLDTLVNMLIGAGMELDMRIRTKPRRAAAYHGGGPLQARQGDVIFRIQEPVDLRSARYRSASTMAAIRRRSPRERRKHVPGSRAPRAGESVSRWIRCPGCRSGWR